VKAESHRSLPIRSEDIAALKSEFTVAVSTSSRLLIERVLPNC
jgi:hypothetical protein